MSAPLHIAIIAGEVSGDLLGADLIAALKVLYPGEVVLTGVGGEGLQAQGLQSLFDYSELSIMGITAVLAKLPKLISRIGQTADAIIAAKPDVLVIIDSPDFTHRVARKVRKALPDLKIVNYVCPSVWAWKEYRAKAMLDYVNLVLAVLPFEPEVMRRLGGPETVYIGHRLASAPDMLAVRKARGDRAASGDECTILLLAGSRGSEVRKMAPVFALAAEELLARGTRARFLMPTVPRQLQLLTDLSKDWAIKPEIATGNAFKWESFAKADAAIAVSGTVILELALAGIPTVSAYKTDWMIKLISHRIKTWTGALPNLIADYVVIPEYVNEVVRPQSLARWIERLSRDTLQRQAMLEGYAAVWDAMQTTEPSGVLGAKAILKLLHS
jgi:lipid-A-disaccharide synthase